MALFPVDEMAVLHSAAEAKSVADTAVDDANVISAAKQINNAANTGSTEIYWTREMTDNLKSTLEGQGYTVNQVHDRTAKPGWYWIISWK